MKAQAHALPPLVVARGHRLPACTICELYTTNRTLTHPSIYMLYYLLLDYFVAELLFDSFQVLRELLHGCGTGEQGADFLLQPVPDASLRGHPMGVRVLCYVIVLL